MDELRYYLMTRPKGVTEKPQKSFIQKHKERLCRQIRNEKRHY